MMRIRIQISLVIVVLCALPPAPLLTPALGLQNMRSMARLKCIILRFNSEDKEDKLHSLNKQKMLINKLHT